LIFALFLAAMSDAISQPEAAADAHDDVQIAQSQQPEQESQQPEELPENPQENAVEDIPAADSMPVTSATSTNAVEEQPESESAPQQQEMRDREQPASDQNASSSEQTDTMQDTHTSADQTAQAPAMTASTSNTGEIAASSDAPETAALSEAQAAALLNVESSSVSVDNKADVNMQSVDDPNHVPSLPESGPTTDEPMQDEAVKPANGDADLNGHAEAPPSDHQPKQESADLPPTVDHASVPAAAGDISMDGSKEQDSVQQDTQQNGEASTGDAQSLDENGRKAPSQDPRDGEAGYHTMKIYIGGLPERTERRDLEDCFGQFGEISHIELRLGFAFIVSDMRRPTSRLPRTKLTLF
jgi:hypothetical protein